MPTTLEELEGARCECEAEMRAVASMGKELLDSQMCTAAAKLLDGLQRQLVLLDEAVKQCEKTSVKKSDCQKALDCEKTSVKKSDCKAK